MNYKHGQSKNGTRAYAIWCSMKSRCYNPKEKAYKNYGGRGIGICDRWLEFSAFYADMGEPPVGMSIERKNNDLGYDPDNCHWATRTEQNRNKRGLHMVTIDGETLPLSAWVERIGAVSYPTAHRRIITGWDPVEAIKTPKITRRAGIPRGTARISGYASDPIVQTSDGPMPLWKAIERSGLRRGTVMQRIQRNGWSPEAALTLPPRKGPRKEAWGAENGVQFSDEKAAA